MRMHGSGRREGRGGRGAGRGGWAGTGLGRRLFARTPAEDTGADCDLECTLASAVAGERLVVGRVCDDCARMHAIRFGMTEGAEITCLTRIPGGPVVLRCGRQEIAVGRRLAQRISVTRLTDARQAATAGEAM